MLEVPSSTAVRVAQRAEQLEEAVEDLLHLPHYHLHQGAGSTQVCAQAAHRGMHLMRASLPLQQAA